MAFPLTVRVLGVILMPHDVALVCTPYFTHHFLALTTISSLSTSSLSIKMDATVFCAHFIMFATSAQVELDAFQMPFFAGEV